MNSLLRAEDYAQNEAIPTRGDGVPRRGPAPRRGRSGDRLPLRRRSLSADRAVRAASAQRHRAHVYARRRLDLWLQGDARVHGAFAYAGWDPLCKRGVPAGAGARVSRRLRGRGARAGLGAWQRRAARRQAGAHLRRGPLRRRPLRGAARGAAGLAGAPRPARRRGARLPRRFGRVRPHRERRPQPAAALSRRRGQRQRARGKPDLQHPQHAAAVSHGLGQRGLSPPYTPGAAHGAGVARRRRPRRELGAPWPHPLHGQSGDRGCRHAVA